MKVRYKQCDECLFGPNKIVSDTRRNHILRDLKRRDTHFVCHKATMNDCEVTCRGDYNRNPMRTSLMQIAARWGVVRFCDDRGEEYTAQAEGEND